MLVIESEIIDDFMELFLYFIEIILSGICHMLSSIRVLNKNYNCTIF